jgi:hypothetical protein
MNWSVVLAGIDGKQNKKSKVDGQCGVNSFLVVLETSKLHLDVSNSKYSLRMFSVWLFVDIFNAAFVMAIKIMYFLQLITVF